MSEKKIKSNFSPSRLKHMRMLIESNSELSDGQKEHFYRLIDKQMPDAASDFAEFHTWIKKGDVLLTSMLEEMDALRQITSRDADLISRSAVLRLFDNYHIDKPANDADNSVNWILGKLYEKVSNLHGKEAV